MVLLLGRSGEFIQIHDRESSYVLPQAVYHPLYAGCTFDRTKNPALVSFVSILVSGLPLLLVILLNIG